MSDNECGSDSDSDSDWNEELIDAVTKKEGKSETITEESRIKRIQVCLKEGADVNASGKNKNTALHFAVKKGYANVVKFLVKKGARSDVPNKSSQTPLTLAQARGEEAILSALKGSQLLSTQPTALLIQTTDAGQSSKRKDTGDNEENKRAKKQRLHTAMEEDEEEEMEISFGEDSQPEDDGVVHQFDGSNKYGASGLKQTLHGNIYQLKLLMLFLKRGLREGYAFRLATEIDAAEKFDDLVFQYKDMTGNETAYRFLQAKHKQDELTKTIGVRDLLTERDDEFSLQKYFISYCKIKRHPELSRSAFKDFILCTNIDFDFEGLAAENIRLEKIDEPDHFLDIKNSTKRSARYKFLVDEQSEIHKILKRTAEAYTLAKMLVEHVFESKDITLRNDIFKLYHTALAGEVIDVENRQFSVNFIAGQNLSERGKSFRKIFYDEAVKQKKLSEKNTSEDAVWKLITENQLKISSSFGQKFDLSIDPKLTDLELFSEELVKLIYTADNNDLVKVNRKIYRKNAREGSNEKIFADNIDKLAGHVLIMKDEKIKFGSRFLDDNIKPPGNLEDLKKSLKTRLRSGYKDLGRYQFEIKNFKTCEEDQLYSKTELPRDDVRNEDIAEFFDKLIFAVNQPNELQLGDVITSEIAADSQFNLLNADLVGDSFQKEMLDWFKEKGKEKGQEGRFFSAEDGKAFFHSAEQKVNTLISSGLGLSYPEELEGYGIEFTDENEELSDFLISDEGLGTKALNVIAADETLPTAIRVHRAIRRSGRYKENDSLIFLHLRTLMLPEIWKRVIRAFESPHSHHLIVVDCGSAANKGLQKLYNRLCETMKKHIGKKVIFISRASKVRLKNCHKTDDRVSFNDLTVESRYKLMEKSVINFQGQRRKTSFGRILGICSCEEISTRKELTNFGATINTKTLIMLLHGDELKVGCDLEGLGEIENYYINRTVNRQVVIKDDVLQSRSISDLVAISGANERLTTDGMNIPSFYETDPGKKRQHGFIILDTEQEDEQFKSLCEMSSQNVHWLKREWGKFIWVKSRGNIDALISHRDDSGSRRRSDYVIHKTTGRYFTEDELASYVEGHKEVVVISDTPGMGKTTLFTYLGRELKSKNPELWVIRVNLNDFTDALQKELKSQSFDDRDGSGAVDFFVEKLSNLETYLEKTVLKMIMKNRIGAGVALLFDGFDEISPEYKNTVINVLRAFQKIGIAKLFVATRPHMREALEHKLGIFSYAMEPFSEPNQSEFLVRFWKRGLGLNNVEERTEARLKTYAESLIENVARSIDDRVKKFAGVPLQTRMIAEVFQDDREGGEGGLETCEEFLRSPNDEPRLPAVKMKILDLYRRFVEKKYHIYRTEKKKDDPTNLGVEEDSHDLHEIFLKRHVNLALHTLFNSKLASSFSESKILPLLLDHREIERTNECLDKIAQGKERTGIITRVIKGQAQFIHRTFAEYFAAVFLTNTLTQADHNPDVRTFIVQQVLSELNYKIIRAFLNGLFLEQSLLSDPQYAVNLSVNDSWKLVLHKGQNLFGETIFHIAANERNYEIIKFMLNRFDGDDQTRKYLLNVKDRFGDTVLHNVTTRRSEDELISLEEDVGAQSTFLVHSDDNLSMVKWLVTNGALINALTNDGRSPLSEAAQSGKLAVLKWLIEKEPFLINSRHKYGKTLLHYAASTGQLEVAKWLVDVGKADLSARINDRKTVLHVAAAKNYWDIVKWLILEKKIDVNLKGHNDWTVLRLAASSGNLEIVKWLVEQGAEVNDQSPDGKTVLYVAASGWHWAIVEWLVEKGAHISVPTRMGETVIHKAVLKQKWDLVKWLVEKEDLNAKDINDLVKRVMEGNRVDFNNTAFDGTILHYAESQKKWDFVKWLVEEKSADVNIRTSSGRTVLGRAVMDQRWDIVRWLVLNRGADFDTGDSNGLSSLHLAASSGQLQLVKFIVEDKGTNIGNRAEDGRTVLHFAAASGEMLLIKWLVEEKGVNVGTQTYRGETVLHHAAFTENWDVVKYLSNLNQVDINAETSNGQTVLSSAIHSGNLEITKWLVEKKDVDAKFSDGKTILHHAVASGHFEIVKWLVADMAADAKIADRNGQTPLHEAVVARQCEIFKWLVDQGVADINIRDNNERTLLHTAAAIAYNNIGVIRLLVESYKIDVTATDDKDKTALDLYCPVLGRDQVVCQLLGQGTSIPGTPLSDPRSCLREQNEHQKIIRRRRRTRRFNICDRLWSRS